VPNEEHDPEARACWNALYESACGRDGWRHTLHRCLAGLKYENRAELEPGMMARVLEAPFAASVSRLERFAACPFAHFADYLLGLEPDRLICGSRPRQVPVILSSYRSTGPIRQIIGASGRRNTAD
jgi:ATP-dependent helicase/DNAse subunit B